MDSWVIILFFWNAVLTLLCVMFAYNLKLQIKINKDIYRRLEMHRGDIRAVEKVAWDLDRKSKKRSISSVF